MKHLSNSKIFLDSSYPEDFKQVLGWLRDAGYANPDGQTTNPSYFIKKNPEIAARFEKGEKYSNDELFEIYQDTVEAIYKLNPADTSIEVYADKDTKAEEMIARARKLISWVPEARVKLPIIAEGLKAAEVLCQEMRLNMTLGFSQAQAAAVDSATKGSKYPVVHSAFVGRLTDRGENGIHNVANVVRMFKERDPVESPGGNHGTGGHVMTLAASFRDAEQIQACLQLGADILTINYDRFELWKNDGFNVPDDSFEYIFDGKDIPYEKIELGKPWSEYDIYHDLTEGGLQQFADDWNSLLSE